MLSEVKVFDCILQSWLSGFSQIKERLIFRQRFSNGDL